MAGEDRGLDYVKGIARMLAPAHGVPVGVIDAVTDTASAQAIGDPALRALLASAVDTRDAIKAADLAKFGQASAAFSVARQNLSGEIGTALARPVASVPTLATLIRQANLGDPAGLRLDARLGPLKVSLDGPPVVADYPNPAGGTRIVFGPQVPEILSGLLAAGPASGGGALRTRPDGLAGVLGLSLGAVDVSAIASLRLVRPDLPSFMAIIGVAFTPGIQVGFGFSLNRVGGLVGINRGLSVDRLGRRLRDGTAGDVLFSTNPAADAPRILPALEELFPSLAGAHLVGPSLQLGWLKVSSGAFFSFDVGVLVELPASRVAVVGVAKAGIPPVLRLRLDVLGLIDFAQCLVAVDASLIDSYALGVFTIAGDAAFRLSFGPQPYTVLTIGGFYPGFKPEPARLPPLRRASLALDTTFPGVYLRASGYLAVTSNTLQLGAAFEAGFQAGPVSATGFFELDALIQFSPFHFHADFAAGFRVRVLGLTFAGIRFNGTIDGPGPIVISGRLTIETFLKDISWHETFTIGSSGGDTRVPRTSLLNKLTPELARPENLHARGGADRLVRLAPRPSLGKLALVPPLAEVVWVQRRAPLGVLIDRLEGVPLGPPLALGIPDFQGVRADATVPAKRNEKALFSPGSFITLSKSEALNKPAFDLLDAGLVLGWPVQERSTSQAPKPIDRKVYRKVVGEFLVPLLDMVGIWADISVGVLDMLADRDQPASVSSTAPQISIVTEAWRTSSGFVHDSATAAHQEVKVGRASLALPSLDLAQPVSLAGV